VASKVARGESDEEILLIAPSVTWDGFTLEQTKSEIRTFIDGARRKGWGAPTGSQCSAAVPEVKFFEDLGPPKQRDYLSAPYLLKGGYNIAGGRGGAGKTTISIALHAWSSVGKFPDGYVCEPVCSIIIELQDPDENEIKPKR
jgi:hypothetical protein